MYMEEKYCVCSNYFRNFGIILFKRLLVLEYYYVVFFIFVFRVYVYVFL